MSFWFRTLADNIFSGAGEADQNLLIKSEYHPPPLSEKTFLVKCEPDQPAGNSITPESQDFKTPVEITGLSEKYIFDTCKNPAGVLKLTAKTPESYEIYITGLRKRFICKESSYPVILLQIANSPLVYTCRLNLKLNKGWENLTVPPDSIYIYKCGHKCGPKNYIRSCRFSGKFQTILTDDQKDPNFWTVENWKIYSIEVMHSCEVHVRNLCSCSNKWWKYVYELTYLPVWYAA